jgi:hypothetical protein
LKKNYENADSIIVAKPNTRITNPTAVRAVVIVQEEIRQDSVFKNYAGGIGNNIRILNPNLVERDAIYGDLEHLKSYIQAVIIKNTSHLGNDGLKNMIAFARARGGFTTDSNGDPINDCPLEWKKASAAMQKDFADIGLFTAAEGEKMLSKKSGTERHVRGYRSAHALDFVGDKLIKSMNRAAAAVGGASLDIGVEKDVANQEVDKAKRDVGETPYPDAPHRGGGRA